MLLSSASHQKFSQGIFIVRILTALLCTTVMTVMSLHAESLDLGSVKVEGLPNIKIGDDVEAVQKALNTTLQPEEMDTAAPTTPFTIKKTQLHLKTRGIWAFFAKGKLVTIRLDLPFAGNINGIKLGDSAQKIEKTLGAPVKRTPWGNLTGYAYYFDDVTTTRLMLNKDDELETIFLEK